MGRAGWRRGWRVREASPGWRSGLCQRRRCRNLGTHTAEPVSAKVAPSICGPSPDVSSGKVPGCPRELRNRGLRDRRWQPRCQGPSLVVLPATRSDPSQLVTSCVTFAKTGLLSCSRFPILGAPLHFGMIAYLNSFPDNLQKISKSETETQT